MTEQKKVRLDHLLGIYSVGSGDWPWTEEYDNLIDQPDTRKLLDRIRAEGIRESILLGTDGRIWDGHHRIVIAMHLGLDSVPVEFAGEPGALAAHDAEVRASVLAEQGEPEWEYGLKQENEYVDVWGVVIDEGRELPAMRGIADVTGERIVRRRSPGPWLPVEEGETP